jgi:hypothetical protein
VSPARRLDLTLRRFVTFKQRGNMSWSGWSVLDGTTSTATTPFVVGSKLYLFAIDRVSKAIRYRARAANGAWGGWQFFGGTSDVPPSVASFNGALYFFAKGLSDRKIYTCSAPTVEQASRQPWIEFGGTTDVTPSVVVFNNRLYIFSVGTDKKIYWQARTKTGAWSGWKAFGGTTDAALTTVVFNKRLHLFSKGTDNRIYRTSAAASGGWTSWTELGGSTNTSLSAIAFGGDLHLFSKGNDNKMYSLILGRNNHWSTWYPVTPVTAMTNAAVSVASFENTLHLFAKGVIDHKHYTQSLYVCPLPFDDDGQWSGGLNWDDPFGSHHGLGQPFSYDFSHPEGGNIRAVRDGQVVFVENNPKNTSEDSSAPGYGTAIALRHNDGSTSIYLHLKFNSTRVKCQQKVVRGEVIALSGNTGQSSSPHLHFGLGSIANFTSTCQPDTSNLPEALPAYFRDKRHTAWRPVIGDVLSSDING